MKKQIIIMAISVLSILMFNSSLTAGEHIRRFGIGLSMTESSPVFIPQYWIGEKVKIEAQIAILHATIDSSNKYTRIKPGLGFSVYFYSVNRIKSFIGMRGAFDIFKAEDVSYSDFLIGPTFGAEYYFSDQFSIRGEYLIQILLTDEEISPNLLPVGATFIETSGFLSANFYF